MFHDFCHRSIIKDAIYPKYLMVGWWDCYFMLIVSHGGHGGAQVMINTIKVNLTPSKTAEYCALHIASLPVVNECSDILKYERAHGNRLIFRALTCGAKKSHERFILPNLDALSGCDSIAQHTKRGQDIAFALFLGGMWWQYPAMIPIRILAIIIAN